MFGFPFGGSSGESLRKEENRLVWLRGKVRVNSLVQRKSKNFVGVELVASFELVLYVPVDHQHSVNSCSFG